MKPIERIREIAKEIANGDHRRAEEMISLAHENGIFANIGLSYVNVGEDETYWFKTEEAEDNDGYERLGDGTDLLAWRNRGLV